MHQQREISHSDSSEAAAHGISSDDDDKKRRRRRRSGESKESNESTAILGTRQRYQLHGKQHTPAERADRSSSNSSVGGALASSPAKTMSSVPIAAAAMNSNKSESDALAGDRNDETMTENIVGDCSDVARKGSQRQNDSNSAFGRNVGNAAGNSRRDRESTHQINVFVLVRLLFHYLEKVDPSLLLEAQAALKDCDRRKRNGDTAYASLSEAIPRRLRRVVGDKHWGRALAIQRDYLLKKQRKQKKQNNLMDAKRHIQSTVVSIDSAGTGLQSPPSHLDQHGPRPQQPRQQQQQQQQQEEEEGEKEIHGPYSSSFGASGNTNDIFAASPTLLSAQQAASQTFSLTGGLPPLGVSSVFNPGLLHRVVVPDVNSPSARAHADSPFEVAQRALAAQVEAYNRAADQLGQHHQHHHHQQQQQNAVPIRSSEPPSLSGYGSASEAPRGENAESTLLVPPQLAPSSPVAIAASASAWQCRRAMSSYSSESSDSSSNNEKE